MSIRRKGLKTTQTEERIGSILIHKVAIYHSADRKYNSIKFTTNYSDIIIVNVEHNSMHSNKVDIS